MTCTYSEVILAKKIFQRTDQNKPKRVGHTVLVKISLQFSTLSIREGIRKGIEFEEAFTQNFKQGYKFASVFSTFFPSLN